MRAPSPERAFWWGGGCALLHTHPALHSPPSALTVHAPRQVDGAAADVSTAAANKAARTVSSTKPTPAPAAAAPRPKPVPVKVVPDKAAVVAKKVSPPTGFPISSRFTPPLSDDVGKSFVVDNLARLRAPFATRAGDAGGDSQGGSQGAG